MGTKSTTAIIQEKESENLFFFSLEDSKDICLKIKQVLEKEINIRKSEVVVVSRKSEKTDLCKVSVSILPIPDRLEQERLLSVLDSFLKTINQVFFAKPLANYTVFYVHKI